MPTVFVSAMSTEMLPPHFEYDDVSDKVLIGQGGYGKIFKGKRDSELAALKVMHVLCRWRRYKERGKIFNEIKPP